MLPAAVHYRGAGAVCVTAGKRARVHVYAYSDGRVLIRSCKGGEKIPL